MDELIHTIPKGKRLYNQLAKPLFINAPKLEKDISLIILDGIKNDFKIKSLKAKFGLKSSSLEHYGEREAAIINRLSESYLRIAICEELGISNIFSDDVLLDTVKTKSNCPDITQLYCNGEIGLEEVLLLKKTPGFEVFRDWLTGQVEIANDNDMNEIIYDFINEVECKTKGIGSKFPVKVLRWAVSILVGIKCPPAFGIVQSAFDSLFIDYFLEQKSPKLFLDDYYKIVK